jgi:hypothetical protein
VIEIFGGIYIMQVIIVQRLTLLQTFAIIEDPRRAKKCDYTLACLLFTATCALLCGCQTFREMAIFANLRYEWLKQFFELKGRAPSADTFAGIFQIMKPTSFVEAFERWVNSVG